MVSFGDFYDLDTLTRQRGLNIITMDQFLEREAANGQLKSQTGSSAPLYPPDNRIHWDNQRLDPLWRYIRNVTKTFQWNPKECVSYKWRMQFVTATFELRETNVASVLGIGLL